MPLEAFWTEVEEIVQEDKAEKARMDAEAARQRAMSRSRRRR